MKYFLVGGAVRDQLLGFPFHERDWVVVGASPEEMLNQGFTPVGKDFPVFLHPETKEEYALARTERKTAPGYTGFSFHTSKEISLEEDLSRRDLTINALAQSESGEIIDPYHGRRDIKDKVLRHVTLAFKEDPVRILRVARFAARYHHLGFTIARETMSLMSDMVSEGEVDHLVAERVWQEFHKALKEKDPHIFILALRSCGALAILAPELDDLFGIPQPEKHHPEIDTGLHSLLSLQQAGRLSDNLTIRFAALIHDLGKALTPANELPRHIAHEKKGRTPVKRLCDRLGVPNTFRELSVLACEYHTHTHRALELKPSTILSLFESCDAFRKPERFHHFLMVCQADAQGRTGLESTPYPQREYLHQALSLTLKVEAKPFVAQGIKGKAIGEAIKNTRLTLLKDFKKSYE